MHIEWWTPRGLDAHREAETLAELRKEPAYVVVGGGAAAQMRAEAATAGAEPISCRDFICFHQTRAQDWKKQPALFLEGFGELRTPIDTLGQQWPEDMRAPLDRLRGALDGLRPKKLRIHTTASRWLGGNDARHLATTSPGGRVAVAYEAGAGAKTRQQSRAQVRCVEIENALSFGSPAVRVQIGALNVLIGANGAGKSNLLRVLRWLGRRRGEAPPAAWMHETAGANPQTPTPELRIQYRDNARKRHKDAPQLDGNRRGGAQTTDTWERFRTVVRRTETDWVTGKTRDASSATAEERADVEAAYAGIIGLEDDAGSEAESTLGALYRLDDRMLEAVAAAAGEAQEELEKLNASAPGAELIERIASGRGARSVSSGTLRYVRRLAEIEEWRAGGTVLMKLPETGLHPDTVAALGRRIAGCETSGQSG